MGHSLSSRTNSTLVGRLGRDPADQEAWREFVEAYGPKIYSWCRHWHLKEADAEEVTQDVLSQLAWKMRRFVYDPSSSFRAWLKTLTHHAWSDFLADRRKLRGSGDSAVWELLQSQRAPDDLVARLEEEYDRELAEEAMMRVRLRVAPAKWDVFRLTALEGLHGAEVAERLGMKVATVFTVRSKVQRMVQEEIRNLEAPAEEPA
jgi:RNA polymerase sigma-70 factor (ECF subfamily)